MSFPKKSICNFRTKGLISVRCRGVAQPGRVLAWGARGRRFESRHPDHKNSNGVYPVLIFISGYVSSIFRMFSTCQVRARRAKGAHKAIAKVGITILSPRPFFFVFILIVDSFDSAYLQFAFALRIHVHLAQRMDHSRA